MRIRQQHYSGEYDQEIGRAPLFSSITTIKDLPAEYEIESVQITYRAKEDPSIIYDAYVGETLTNAL